jgi:hypothetical protein
MENTKALQGSKYYPSSNSTQEARSLSIFLKNGQTFQKIFDENNNDVASSNYMKVI